jgi:hypothetical protein
MGSKKAFKMSNWKLQKWHDGKLQNHFLPDSAKDWVRLATQRIKSETTVSMGQGTGIAQSSRLTVPLPHFPHEYQPSHHHPSLGNGH